MFWTLYGYLPKWGGPKGGEADAVIKYGESRCFGTVVVEHAGKVIEVTRQRPSKLTLKVNGEAVEGKVSDLDKRIPEFLGMTDRQFLLAVYMPQKRKDSFYSMSDADRTQLLSVVAGLEELDAALFKAKSERSRLQTEIDFLKGKISAGEENILKYPEDKLSYQTKIGDAIVEYEKYANEAQALTNEVDIKIAKLQEEFEIKTKDILERTEAIVLENEEKMRSLKIESERLGKEISESPQVPQELFDAVDKARERLNQEKLNHQKRDRVIMNNTLLRQQIAEQTELMDSALSGNCNHCKQELPEATRQEQAMKHLAKAKELECRLEKLPGIFKLEVFEEPLEAALKELTLKQQELNERPRILKAEWLKTLESMKSVEQILDVTRTSSRKEVDAEKSTLDRQIQTLRQSVKDAQNKSESALKVAGQYGESLKILEERESKEISVLNENREKLLNLQSQLDEVLDLIDLFGPKGFRTVCFEDLIARISDRAGQLMSIMTEGFYSTRIEQNGETGKGEHRVILRPVITRGGVEVSSDDLSGGAEATITLAYDVAISEAIAENSPLFLDEALDGLDAQGKSEAIRLVEEVSRTRPVFLIDHTNEIKSSVQNVIMITYKNDTSTLENDNEDNDSSSAVTG